MDQKTYLCVPSLGLALGITWGVGLFVLAWLSIIFSWGTPMLAVFASFYIGYDHTVVGSFLGLFWGFLDGFVGGVVIAWLYNLIHGKCSR